MTRFGALVAVSDAVAATRSRTEKVRRLADFLRAVPPGAVASTLRFLSGRSGRERLGVGPAAVDEAWRAAAPAAEATLGLEDVIAALAAVRDLCGEGSAAERSRRLGELFARATAPERSFLARWLVGELRQGALEGVLTEAVAAAAGIEAATVREVLMVEGDLAVVGEQALRAGRAGLAGGAIQLFRPVLPMLAGTASSPAEALERFGEVAVEAKLDGVRIQVHKAGERIEVYSRKRKPLTDALPEVVERVRRLAAGEAILDGEAIALRADGRPEPFQDTMRRFGRKLDVDEVRREMPLSARFFDCLLVGEHPCIAQPQRERWRILGEIVPPDLRIAALCTAEHGALARRRGRHRRRAAEPALPRWGGAALCPRQALPDRQEPRRGRPHRHRPRLAALPPPAPVAGCKTCGGFVSARSTGAENARRPHRLPVLLRGSSAGFTKTTWNGPMPCTWTIPSPFLATQPKCGIFAGSMR